MYIFLNPSIQNLGIWFVEMKARERVYTSGCLSLLTPTDCKFVFHLSGWKELHLSSVQLEAGSRTEEDHKLLSNSVSKREQMPEWQIWIWQQHQQLWREAGPEVDSVKPRDIEPCERRVDHIVFKGEKTAWIQTPTLQLSTTNCTQVSYEILLYYRCLICNMRRRGPTS